MITLTDEQEQFLKRTLFLTGWDGISEKWTVARLKLDKSENSVGFSLSVLSSGDTLADAVNNAMTTPPYK